MSAGARLRQARQRIGFTSAAAAAKAIGVPIATYTGHESDHRGYPAKKAELYAKHFHVSVNWLLFGSEEKTTGETHRVPVLAKLEKDMQLQVLRGPKETVEAPPDPSIKYAVQLAHECGHFLAGWTLYGEEKTERLSELSEGKLCYIDTFNGPVLGKPVKTGSSVSIITINYVMLVDARIRWLSRIVASRA